MNTLPEYPIVEVVFRFCECNYLFFTHTRNAVGNITIWCPSCKKVNEIDLSVSPVLLIKRQAE